MTIANDFDENNVYNDEYEAHSDDENIVINEQVDTSTRVFEMYNEMKRFIDSVGVPLLEYFDEDVWYQFI